jgi:ABC-2 type transport system ATP-binding protein
MSGPSNGKVLECTDLHKTYGDRVAVNGVGFFIAPGESYGLLGPNGAGKTTTISMVCGLLARDAGDVMVDGKKLDVTSTDTKAARENLSFFGHLYGLGGKDLAARMDEVLEITGLTDRADDRTDKYSGGMKRRLNIGIALLHRPKLLILDEPTVGVDPQSRNAILSSVEQLSDRGMAVLYTTHYMEEAERLCDRVGIIDEGEIKAEGTRRELVAMLGEKDHVTLGGTGDLHAAAASIEMVPEVESAGAADGQIRMLVNGASRVLPDILQRASGAGASITSVDIVEPDLEAVFLNLTGKALRD